MIGFQQKNRSNLPPRATSMGREHREVRFMAGEKPHPLIRQIRRMAVTLGGASVSDGQLLSQYTAARDEAAFAAIVRRHGPMV
jgi:hypothetical protein